METGTLTIKTIISWVIGLVPVLLFYLEYRSNKKQSGKKLGELEAMLIKEIVARKDLEKKLVEEDLNQMKVFYSHAQKEWERYRQEAEKLENVNAKLRFKLIMNHVRIEPIDLDETPLDEWDKVQEKKKPT